MPEPTDADPASTSSGSATSRRRREMSPFFSLPNEDGQFHTHPNPGDGGQSEFPPTTLSCANCERIVGDSSAFLCATRQMKTITLASMVSVTIGVGGLKTSMEGEWDEFCNYKNIDCAKCSHFLGKMYFATTAKLSPLQNKFTISLPSISFYQHGSTTPSLPVATTSEIYAYLHPSPEDFAQSIDRVMTMCVMLREEQADIIRAVKKVGARAGVEVEIEDSGSGEGEGEGEGGAGEDWKGKVEGVLERLERLETAVGGIVIGGEGAGVELLEKRGRAAAAVGKTEGGVTRNKRKRRSGAVEDGVSGGAVDLLRDADGLSSSRFRRGREIADSQSFDDDRVAQVVGVEVEVDEDEDEDSRIKSPAERRRQQVRPLARRGRFMVMGHRS